MTLSAKRKRALEDRYEIWGLDQVREELERPDRAQFVDPEITVFAREWVDAKVASAQNRKNYLIYSLSIVGLVLLGLAITAFLDFYLA